MDAAPAAGQAAPWMDADDDGWAKATGDVYGNDKSMILLCFVRHR
jgi:hypothetical protein